LKGQLVSSPALVNAKQIDDLIITLSVTYSQRTIVRRLQIGRQWIRDVLAMHAEGRRLEHQLGRPVKVQDESNNGLSKAHGIILENLIPKLVGWFSTNLVSISATLQQIAFAISQSSYHLADAKR
jgi:hypothetical protein